MTAEQRLVAVGEPRAWCAYYLCTEKYEGPHEHRKGGGLREWPPGRCSRGAHPQLEVLRHQVQRDHDFNPAGCSGCSEAVRALDPDEAERLWGPKSPTAPPPFRTTTYSPELANPACSSCGGITQRTGACYTCTTCGTSTGCG